MLSARHRLKTEKNISTFAKGLGAIRAKIGPTSDVDKNVHQNVFTICAFQK